MKRTALVTGGTRGIGAGISKALSRAGYSVAANYRSGDANAEKFQDETGIRVFSWDVSDYESCEKGVARVCEALGGPVDVLVNNAGVTRDCMLHKMSRENWTKVIETNLNSVFNMCRSVILSMREKNFGRIVNISSVNGLKGQLGQSNYSAAKAGIIGFTKALALESASKGITVNAIAPGYVSTDMTDAIREDVRENILKGIPVGRFGQVEEIADAVLFLADEKSSFITGTVLSINGGQYL
jgi:acetoacetyl-CoA reductase